MDTTRVIRAVSVLAVLVLAFSVASALADGVTSSRRDSALITSDTSHAFNPVAATHVEFALEGWARSDGIRDGYLLRKTLFNGPRANIISNPPPPTSTPEPGTLLMLAAGLGALVFGWRQRVSQP